MAKPLSADFLRGIVKAILATLSFSTAIRERSEFILQVLDSEEMKDLSNEQKWDVQRQIREELRKQAIGPDV